MRTYRLANRRYFEPTKEAICLIVTFVNTTMLLQLGMNVRAAEPTANSQLLHPGYKQEQSSMHQRMHQPLSRSAPHTPPIASGKLIQVERARLYVLSLVNSDRARNHLSRLTLDRIATSAGQFHSDEMCTFGYCGHYDFLGRTPYDRYAEAGGSDFVGENVAIRGNVSQADHQPVFVLKKNHMYSPSELNEFASLQSMFMAEKPPDDGHRIQILQPEHTGLGIGLSYAENTKGDYRITLTEEFTDKYGEYSELPKNIGPGNSFVVSGAMVPGVEIYSISIYPGPKLMPMTKEELNGTKGYAYPGNAIVSFFSVDKVTPLKRWTQGKRQHFKVQITPDDSWKPGLYYVQIAAVLSKGKEPIRVSCRQIQLN